MNFLLLSLLLSFTSSMNYSVGDGEKMISSDPLVDVTITTTNGDVIQKQILFTDLGNEIMLEEGMEVSQCTYVSTSGDCETTASTCKEAKQGFVNCMCSNGLMTCPKE